VLLSEIIDRGRPRFNNAVVAGRHAPRQEGL
jgi:hypothetical protein